MAHDHPPHHIRLAIGPERGTGRACPLDPYQFVNDRTAFDQQAMNISVQPVNPVPDSSKRVGFVSLHSASHGPLNPDHFALCEPSSINRLQPQGKEKIDREKPSSVIPCLSVSLKHVDPRR